MIKYIILTLLFLLKISFLFGQNEDSLFHVITKKHENTPYYTIIKGDLNTHIKDEYKKDIVYSYEFIQRKHKNKIFVFLILSSYGLNKYYRYYSSKNKTDKHFSIIDKNEDRYWHNIELMDLNNDNIREIAIYYEHSYPCNYKEIYNFSVDSIAPAILQRPYDGGVLVCIDTTKNLYFNIERMNGRGMWDSELFVINKDFSKGNVLAKASWDDAFCSYCFDIYVKQKERFPFMTYFSSNSKSVINNFHPHVDHWNSKENIEFMKNAYLKMIEEFGIEY
ncbi:hypothetical protein [Bernardetia sp. MNP-M8]|uniref:hypothetical protein n=1 Tax=Bernardetia sp. MNP-M8 TaxID=3127470 RepID=UPI0030CA7A43